MIQQSQAMMQGWTLKLEDSGGGGKKHGFMNK